MNAVPHVISSSGSGFGYGDHDSDSADHPQKPSQDNYNNNNDNHPAGRRHRRHHHHQHATVRRLLFPWIWTILLTVTLIVVVKVYEGKDVITAHEKDSFNGLSTALILLLGLSFFEAFKALARGLRPRIHRWFQPPEEAKYLVDGFDNMLQVVELTFKRIPGISFGLRAFCVLWVSQEARPLSTPPNPQLTPCLQIALCMVSVDFADGNVCTLVFKPRNPYATNRLRWAPLH